MNERIRELAIQAGLNAPYGSDHEGLRDFDYEKFAELIVKECIDFCSRVCMERIQGDCPHNNREDIEALNCAQSILREATKHFGKN